MKMDAGVSGDESQTDWAVTLAKQICLDKEYLHALDQGEVEANVADSNWKKCSKGHPMAQQDMKFWVCEMLAPGSDGKKKNKNEKHAGGVWIVGHI